MTDTQAELREKFSKQHEKWLIGTCDDAEAAQEWVKENLPSLLALLPPAPAVCEAVPLKECPPGLFLWNGNLCFRSEYATMTETNLRQPDAYVVESGEYF